MGGVLCYRPPARTDCPLRRGCWLRRQHRTRVHKHTIQSTGPSQSSVSTEAFTSKQIPGVVNRQKVQWKFLPDNTKHMYFCAYSARSTTGPSAHHCTIKAKLPGPNISKHITASCLLCLAQCPVLSAKRELDRQIVFRIFCSGCKTSIGNEENSFGRIKLSLSINCVERDRDLLC